MALRPNLLVTVYTNTLYFQKQIFNSWYMYWGKVSLWVNWKFLLLIKGFQQPHYFSIYIRDMLIWQIEKYLYPTSILGMIYHIRADAFIFFGLWCSHMRAIQPNFGVKLNNSIHLDWITFRLHKLSSFTILHWMTLTFESIPLWKVVYWNPIVG